MGSLFTDEHFFARNCQQNLRRSLLVSSNMRLDFTKQKKVHCWSKYENADEKPLYFVELSNYTGNDVREKSVVMKTSADSSKLPPFVILDHKTKPKEQMPRKITVSCQSKCWMAEELLQDWLALLWNRSVMLLGEQQ